MDRGIVKREGMCDDISDRADNASAQPLSRPDTATNPDNKLVYPVTATNQNDEATNQNNKVGAAVVESQ